MVASWDWVSGFATFGMALAGSTFAFAARVVKSAMKMSVAALIAKSAGTHSLASNGRMIAIAAIRSGLPAHTL